MSLPSTNIVIFVVIFAWIFNIGDASTKYSCDGLSSTEDCRTIFDRLVLEQNAKLIYIHLKGGDINGTDKETNPLQELVWVKDTSLYYLSYPDDFEALSFGLLSDYIYDMDIDMKNDSFLTTGDVLNFTYASIITNSTNSFICHRFFEDQNLRNLSVDMLGLKMYFANVIWFGYDYKCHSTIDSIDSFKSKSTRISKYPPMMVVIATLCILSMFWFPILITQIEQKNASRRDCNADVATKRKRAKLNKHDSFVYYNQGDIPYGLGRLLLIFCRSKYEFGPQGVLWTYIPYIRFFIFTTTVGCILYYYVDAYIHSHLPHDIQDYAELFTKKRDVIDVFFLLIYFLLLCTGFMSRKNYTYVFDMSYLFPSGHSSFLRKVHFKKLYPTEEAIMSNTVVNRFTSLFRLQFWVMVFVLSRRGPQRLLGNKTRCRRCCCIIIWILNAFVLFLNVLFIIVVSLLPFIWYTFCMSQFAFNVCHKLIPRRLKLYSQHPAAIIIKVFVFFGCLYLWFYYLFYIFIYHNIILKMISIFVRTITYVLFIAFPQLNALQFRLIFLAMAVTSYVLKHLQSFQALYQEILQKMFSFVGKKHNIEIQQFDYVVANTFPVHIEAFYLLSKLAFTCAFLYISLSTFLVLDNKDTREDWELINISSFVVILISPAAVGYIFITPEEKRVASYNKAISELMESWKNNVQSPKKQNQRKCVLCNFEKTSCSNVCFFCILFCCGCIAEIDNNWDCYFCTYFKVRNLESSNNIELDTDKREELDLQEVVIAEQEIQRSDKLGLQGDGIVKEDIEKRTKPKLQRGVNDEHKINTGEELEVHQCVIKLSYNAFLKMNTRFMRFFNKDKATKSENDRHSRISIFFSTIFQRNKKSNNDEDRTQETAA